MALVEQPYMTVRENGVRVIYSSYTYDDGGGAFDQDNGPIVSARIDNTSTDLTAGVILTRYATGQVFRDTVLPGQSKSWNTPAPWGSMTLSDMGVTMQVLFPTQGRKGGRSAHDSLDVTASNGFRVIDTPRQLGVTSEPA